jgi:hypothetical protein
MELPQLQPIITIKLPFQDVFVAVTLPSNTTPLRDDTSNVDYIEKLQFNQLDLNSLSPAGCNKITCMLQ